MRSWAERPFVPTGGQAATGGPHGERYVQLANLSANGRDWQVLLALWPQGKKQYGRLYFVCGDLTLADVSSPLMGESEEAVVTEAASLSDFELEDRLQRATTSA